jgi:hypothetical protein
VYLVPRSRNDFSMRNDDYTLYNALSLLVENDKLPVSCANSRVFKENGRWHGSSVKRSVSMNETKDLVRQNEKKGRGQTEKCYD